MIALYEVQALAVGGRWHTLCSVRDYFDACRLAALAPGRRVMGPTGERADLSVTLNEVKR